MPRFTPPEKIPPERVQFKDFGGLATRPNPNDIKPGAARVQQNVTCVSPGELRVRPGLRQVSFDPAT